jgi:hypothetical protein
LAVVAIVVGALRGGARACEPIPDRTHTIDASMQATDQTPPTLPVIPAPTFHYGEDVSDACTAKCTSPTYVGIPAVATDDTTNHYSIGYRFSLASGTLPLDLDLPTAARDPVGDVVRVHFNPDTTPSMDFTLQVVAIDLAGNESAPQTVHVEHHADSECSIAGGRVSRPGVGWIVFAALIVTGYRRRRRPETC